MPKDILQFFEEFRELPVNYSDPKFQESYRQVLKQDNFEKALAYDDWRSNKDERDKQEVTETLNGAFHLVLNVKTDANSDFFPFAYVTNTCPKKKESAQAFINDRQKDIKYNFSQLLDKLTETRQDGTVESISFKTSFDESGRLVLDDSKDVNIDDNIATEELRNIIIECIHDSSSFINILSTEYHKRNIADCLYYDILSFDLDAKSGQKLTQFLLISENSEECYYFMQVRVRALRDIVSIIRTRYINDIAQKNLYESIKSAVAAIMSRNMSHNLGSHFIYYAKAHLASLADTISERISPDIRGAAKVLEYTQARMDYLATLISNDKYPYGAVNFKSQIYDELTLDDFSKRHFSIGIDDQTKRPKQYNRTMNYLLTNLVLSEDFTRPNIYDDDYTYSDRTQKESNDLLNLQVKFSEDGVNYKTFTGTNYKLDADDDPEEFVGVVTMASEDAVKQALSSINIAMPGGNMSCHAFFNVIENFIRNSAKYLRDDFERDGNHNKTLTTTIAMRYSDESHEFIEFIIYDDKKNATRYKLQDETIKFFSSFHSRFPAVAIDEGIKQLSLVLESSTSVTENEQIKILETIIDFLLTHKNEDNNILLSAAKSLLERWRQPCLFEQMRNRLSSIKILGDNNVLDKENKGLKEMMFSSAWMRSYTFPEDKTYADIIFDIQNATDNKEKIIQEHCFIPVSVLECDNGSIQVFKNIEDLGQIAFSPASFGILIELPTFQKLAKLPIIADERLMIQNCLHVKADMVFAEGEIESPLNISRTFTRTCTKEDLEENNPTKILRAILRRRFPRFDDYKLIFGGHKEAGGLSDSSHVIKFRHHLKFHEKLEDNRCFAYADSVSGGNFTKTMNELFDSYVDDEGNYIDSFENGEYFCLKIKESALTRITIIDERLARSMFKSGLELELQLKNVRILNYQDCSYIQEITDLFVGNSFSDGSNSTHFLSIHLGLIEKIIKSDEFIEFIGDIPETSRAQAFMDVLRKAFGGENVFISVHSGRGNFSAELEDQLANYPFISLSAIENTYNNSKYLLSQLFYNTVYIGKGRINHIKNETSSNNN